MSSVFSTPVRVVLLMGVVALVAACDRGEALCEPGSCPLGYSCAPSTGQCLPQQPSSGPELAFFGPITAATVGGASPAVVGYVAERQSLAATAAGQVAWLAGPAADPADPPAGQVSAAAAAADGTLRVAWIRAADATLWYAKGKVGGSWQRQRVVGVAAGQAAAPLAIAVHGGQAVLAFRDPLQRQAVVARRSGESAWLVEPIPLPSPPAGGAPTTDVGQSLALVSLPGGLAVSAYDATHGDLLLAIRSTTGWSVSRVDGSDSETGADTGDVGLPSAMATGPDGSPVIVYRDRSRSQIRLARVTSGVLSTSKVVDALRSGPAATVQHTLRGSALTVAVRPDGRAIVAWFDGSDWTVGCVEQLPSGHFTEVPLGEFAYPRQIWPALTMESTGPWLSMVALDPQRGPMGTRLVQRKLAMVQP
jgi:hypothetical protein